MGIICDQSFNYHSAIDPNMWVALLKFFANAEEDFSNEISQVLKGKICNHINWSLEIEKTNVLPPMYVIQILASRRKIRLGSFKDYLIKQCQQVHEYNTKSFKQMNEAIKETEKMREQLHNLSTQVTVFQSTDCSSETCGKPLDRPSIHFLCLHSYHKRCLGNYKECPRCSSKNKALQRKLKELEDPTDKQEQFEDEMNQEKAKTEGYSIVAQHFSKGIFRPPTVSNQTTIF